MMIKYDSTRVFAIFFIYSCVLTFAVAFNNMVEAWTEDIADNVMQKKLINEKEKFTAQWAQKLMGADGTDCTKHKFALACLLEMNILVRNEVIPLLKVKIFLSFGVRVNSLTFLCLP